MINLLTCRFIPHNDISNKAADATLYDLNAPKTSQKSDEHTELVALRIELTWNFYTALKYLNQKEQNVNKRNFSRCLVIQKKKLFRFSS